MPSPPAPDQWTDDDDEFASDAVIVGSDGPALEAAGLPVEPVLASVHWPARLFRGDLVEARMEGPFDPPNLRSQPQRRPRWIAASA